MFNKKIFPNNKFSEPKKSKISVVVKVPGLNNLNKNNGCRNAGNSILASLNEDFKVGVEEIHVDNSNLEEQNKLIYKNALDLIETNDKIIFLGGDHSISFPIGKAFLDFCKKQNKQASLIVFDAHADCDFPCKEPTHEEWLRALIESGFNAENVLLVGVRKLWKVEEDFLSKNRIKRININDLNENLEEVTDIIMEFSNGKELYVSFDIDVIDPAFAPSTYYKEPGGLTSREAIYIISRISKMKNLKIFDLVEVNAEEDKKNNNLTVNLASKIIEKLL